jgi:hypothetical protein
MKRLPVLFSGFFILMLTGHAVLGQTRKPAGSTAAKNQLKPKFSEMTDYGIPEAKGVEELPGGKPPESNQINPNGSIKINRTEEITVPAEPDSPPKGDKRKQGKAAIEKGAKEKQRVRKP